MGRWMGGWIDGGVGRWMDICRVDRWIGERMNEWKDIWVGRWKNGWMNG